VARRLGVLACVQWPEKTIPFLMDHLTLEFWLIEREKYERIVNVMLDVVNCLFEEKRRIVAPFAPRIAVFCEVQKSRSVLRKLSQAIGCPEFSVDEDEVAAWASACGDVQIAMRACCLLRRITKEPDSVKCDIVLDTISVIANLLPESMVDTFDDEIALITALFELAALFDRASAHLREFVIAFIRVPQFGQLFNTALELFDRLVISSISDFSLSGDFVLFTLIATQLSSAAAVDRIFSILLRLVRSGFHFPDPSVVCFALQPHLIGAAADEFFELSVLLDPLIVAVPSDFGKTVRALFTKVSVEHSYLILSFFVNCAVVSNDRYYDPVFRIARVVIDKTATDGSRYRRPFSALCQT
jgi:hypothetical protein